MAFIKYNKEKAKASASQFGAIADGEYELIVLAAEWRPLLDKPDKTPHFNLKLGIRSDVVQEHQGRNVFHDFYVSREEDKVEKSMEFINRFNFALDVPDEVEFETEEQWVNYIIGKAVKGKLVTSKREYNGKTYENTDIKNFSETEFPNVAKVDKPAAPRVDKPAMTKIDDDPFVNDNGVIDISDDDLPF